MMCTKGAGKPERHARARQRRRDHRRHGYALVAVVCNLTIGKRKYRDVEDEVRSVLAKAEELRHRLTGMIEDDVTAFNAVMGR
jgi:formiminotetrahydrofolate cyclodeaminase